jgi:hypothetical protein
MTAGISRRRALVFLAITTVAIGIVLAVLDGRMRDSGGPGIVGFEFAGSEEGAAEILADWGEEGEDAARASLWIDYLYILAYAGFLTLAAIATRDLAATRGWRRMAVAAVAVIPIAAAAGAFDAIEDAGLLLALDGHGGDLAPLLATICATLKFALLALVITYLAVGLLLRLRARRAAGPN